MTASNVYLPAGTEIRNEAGALIGTASSDIAIGSPITFDYFDWCPDWFLLEPNPKPSDAIAPVIIMAINNARSAFVEQQK